MHPPRPQRHSVDPDHLTLATPCPPDHRLRFGVAKRHGPSRDAETRAIQLWLELELDRVPGEGAGRSIGRAVAAVGRAADRQWAAKDPEREFADSRGRRSGAEVIMTDKLIDRRPEILGGRPVFSGKRVPVRILMEHLEAGDRLDEFLDDYPTVTRDQAVKLLERAKTELVDYH